MHTIEQLSFKYAHDSSLSFFYLGDSNLPAMRVSSPIAECTISLYGAQVLSYIPATSKNSLIWENPEAIFKEGKAIRGGIPICWPWFNAHATNLDAPNHGFARLRVWEIDRIEHYDNEVIITLSLPITPEDKNLFPYQASLTYSIRIGTHLTIALTTTNLDTKPFSYSAALHSYFKVNDIDSTLIHGLKGCDYFDETRNNLRCKQNEELMIVGEIDRFYMNVPNMLCIEDSSINQKISVLQTGSASTQVWNPGKERAAQMADFRDLDYKKMVCIEAVNLHDTTILLAPNGVHHLVQEIKFI